MDDGMTGRRVCGACGATNEASSAFCTSCGASLQRTCPSCGTAVPEVAAFCGTCGAPLTPGAEPAPLGQDERKVVSVLFADLEASTELATRLDPEELRAVYAPFFEAMSGEIERYGGTIEKFIGDAIVGVFGVPVAHEDDPVRAVRAGLAMQSTLGDIAPRLAASVGGDLAMRVAIHTGEVLATPGEAHEARVTGETTSVAARLQTAAPSGSVVVSGRTYRDARHVFAFEAVGDVALKGVPEPVAVHRAVGEARPGRGAPSSPLVGRGDEIELLHVLLRRTAKEGRPFLVTVVGTAGIGKSRLAADVAREAERGDIPGAPTWRVIRGRCLPYEEGVALWPLAEMLKSDAGILDSDAPATILEKARSRLGERPAIGGAEAIEILLSSLGIATGTDPLSGADRNAASRMIADAWRGYIASLATNGPVVTLIEDIHWADRSLLTLLEHLVARTQAPVLFLCLARPELMEAHPTWGTGLANSVTLDLPALSRDEEAILLGNLIGGSIDPSLQRAIGERVGGNPFFAGELVRMLIEDGSIERREGVWTGTGEVSAQLPDTVQAAIAARIDRLDPAEKRVIQDASVVGRVFWDGVLDALASGDRSRAIDSLIDRGLVRELPSSSIGGARELQFEHVLIKDVAYASIPKARRPDAHRAVLAWIETVTRGRDEEFSELMAHHASIAGDAERTARYAMLAGHRHRRVFAAEEAIQWYERALTATEQLPGDTALLLAEIAFSRGDALEQLARLDEARADYERALRTVRSAERGRGWLEANILAAIAHVLWIQDRYEDGRAMLPEALAVARASGMPDVEARLLYTAGAIAWGRTEWERAESLHREALRVAEAADDLEGQAYARHGLTETGLFRGPLEDALEEAMRSQALWRRLGRRPMIHHDGELLGWLYVLLGRLDEAEAAIEETLAGQRELGQRRDQPFTLVPSMLTQLARGALGDALASADEAVEIASAVGAPRPELLALLFRMLLYAEIGAPDLAEPDLPIARGRSDRLGGGLFHPSLLSAQGWLQLHGGDRDAALRSFADGKEEAEHSVLHRAVCAWFEIRAWAIVGDASGLRDAATWVLESDTHPGIPTEALATWALARAEALDGRLLEAHERARDALRLAEEAGDAPVTWRAAAVAAQTTEDRVEAGDLRRRAADIVRAMGTSFDDSELEARFLAQPAVAEVLDTTA
jgi:class 3 adenylate cyclase/tetratricopeptide (TPR) repeat protein